MAQLGIGIVGAGTIAQNHLRSLTRGDEGRPVAVYDVVAERATRTAADFGIPYVARTLEDLLERRDVEAVIVCTPPFAHADQTILALESGKHVLCEKPYALSASDVERMVQVAESSHRFLAFCSARTRMRTGPRTAHQMATSGALGQVYYVHSSLFRLRGRPISDNPHASPWFVDKARAGGGALMDIGGYSLDLALWLLGNPRVTSVLSSTSQGIGGPLPAPLVQSVEDHAVVTFSCDNGASGTVEIAWRSNIAGVDRTFVLGTEAGLLLYPLRKITAGPDGEPVEELLVEVPDQDRSPYGDVTLPFVRAVLEGRQPETPGAEALEVARVIDAAYQSAASGKAVVLTDGSRQETTGVETGA